MHRPDLEGALVTLVLTGSPAEQSGVAKGDVIVGYDAKPVASATDLRTFVKGAPAGAKASLQIVRGQGEITLVVQR
jgi:serine protease Do